LASQLLRSLSLYGTFSFEVRHWASNTRRAGHGKKKKLKYPYPLQGRELSDPARSERRQKGQRAESQVTGDGDSQCCFIWSNLSGIVESFQKAPTNHSL